MELGRRTLRFAAALFAYTFPCFALALPAAANATVSTAVEGPRSEQLLAAGWRFHFGEAAPAVTASGYDDSAWQPVNLPHTWNRVGTYDGTPSPNTQRGVGWYRLAFELPKPDGKRRQFLQFDGVAVIAEVWVNGTRVGEHRGSYARFRFDVSALLKPGQNLIVVKADNSKAEAGSSTQDVLPLGGDYFPYGGIYRSVSLLSTDSAQIDVLDHGGPGVYLSTPSVSAERAEVSVLTRLRNLGGKQRKLSLVTSMLDAHDQVVASDSAPVKLAKNTTSESRRNLVLDNPTLWQGREHPYLYRVAVELRDGDRVLDRVVQPLGLRTFAFDADRGFILNGKPLRLHGASRHQDRAGKGWALSAEDHAQDMATMIEIGANTVRQAHYEHAQEWSDAADAAGMIVWAELPYTHETSVTHAPLPSDATVANAKSQLIELIRQNYNHPSIAIWAMGNEVDVGALVEKRRNGGKTPLSQPHAFLKMLSDLAHSEDPSRVTSYADCCEDSPLSQPGLQTLTGATDVTAYNRYFGWYYGEPADMGKMLDKFHAKHPQQPIGISEYGAGGAFSQHTDNPEGGPPDAMGRPHPEEYQSWYHEQNWAQIEQRPYLFATWIWNLFDFAVTGRAEGESIDINDKGLVHHDHQQRKDAFYFYKAQWSSEPVLYLNGRHYVDRAYAVVDVRAYSNADKASLTLNGKAVGEVSCAQRICVWPAVKLAKGENTLEASASIGGKTISDRLNWTAPDPAAGLRVMAGTLTGRSTSDGSRYGSDNFFIGGKGRVVVPFLIPNRKPKIVAGTASPELYESYRDGSFRYELPVPDGQWKLKLHFFEPEKGKLETRTFDVSAGGKTVLRDFSIGKTAGDAMTAVVREVPVKVKGGKLVLEFTAKGGPALVSAIEVVR